MIKMKLRTKIATIFVFMILLPLSIMNFLLITQMRDSLQENTLSTFKNIGMEISNEIERLVNNWRDDIVVLANNPILQSENTTTSEKLEQLVLTQDFHEIYDDITLIDAEGRVITSTTYNYRGEWGTNEWYKRSLNGSIVVSDAHVILDPWKVVLVFLSPIVNEGSEINGVVAGQIDLKQIWMVLDNFTIGDTGFAYSINNDGKIISHPNKDYIFTKLPHDSPVNSVLKNQTGTTNYVNEDGEEMICSYTPLLSDAIYENNGFWGVIVAQQSEEVLTSVTSFQKQILYVFIIFIGIIIIVSFLFSHSIIKPIVNLKNTVREIREGNFDTKIEVKSNDEVGELADAFTDMAKDLKGQQENLEKTVAERTKELNKKIDELERYKKITINRELKMVELKKTINELYKNMEK